jgi:hypothetical protein
LKTNATQLANLKKQHPHFVFTAPRILCEQKLDEVEKFLVGELQAISINTLFQGPKGSGNTSYFAHLVRLFPKQVVYVNVESKDIEASTIKALVQTVKDKSGRCVLLVDEMQESYRRENVDLLYQIHEYLTDPDVLLFFTGSTTELARLMLDRDPDLAHYFPLIVNAPDFNHSRTQTVETFSALSVKDMTKLLASFDESRSRSSSRRSSAVLEEKEIGESKSEPTEGGEEEVAAREALFATGGNARRLDAFLSTRTSFDLVQGQGFEILVATDVGRRLAQAFRSSVVKSNQLLGVKKTNLDLTNEEIAHLARKGTIFTFSGMWYASEPKFGSMGQTPGLAAAIPSTFRFLEGKMAHIPYLGRFVGWALSAPH